MDQDLEAPLETPEGEGEAQETAENGEAGAVAPPPEKPPKVDLHQIPEYQRMQSEAARARNEKERLEQQLRATNTQLQALVAQVKDFNPDAYDQLQTNFRIQQLEATIASQQQELSRVYDAEWTNIAANAGVDTSSPAFKYAFRLLQSGDATAIQELIEDGQAAQTRQPAPPPPPQPSAPQNSQEEVVTTTPKQPRPGYVPPPQGAPAKPLSDAEKDTLFGQLNELMNEPTKNRIRIAELKQKLGL